MKMLRLIQTDKMKYSVDEIIDDIIKLENLETRDLVYLNKKDFDFAVKENDILVYENGVYRLDDKAKEERLKFLREKLERLKNSEFK